MSYLCDPSKFRIICCVLVIQNYTDIGFKKIRAPDAVFKLISDFWEANKDKQSLETWGVANTYTNNCKYKSTTNQS